MPIVMFSATIDVVDEEALRRHVREHYSDTYEPGDIDEMDVCDLVVAVAKYGKAQTQWEIGVEVEYENAELYERINDDDEDDDADVISDALGGKI